MAWTVTGEETGWASPDLRNPSAWRVTGNETTWADLVPALKWTIYEVGTMDVLVDAELTIDGGSAYEADADGLIEVDELDTSVEHDFVLSAPGYADREWSETITASLDVRDLSLYPEPNAGVILEDNTILGVDGTLPEDAVLESWGGTLTLPDVAEVIDMALKLPNPNVRTMRDVRAALQVLKQNLDRGADAELTFTDDSGTTHTMTWINGILVSSEEA